MTRLLAVLESTWVWVYTAGMSPADGDDRRAEVRSDQWEFSRYAGTAHPPASERMRRLLSGLGDDIAWRAGFRLSGLSRARQHEFILLIGMAGLLAVSVPAAAWWCVALAGNSVQPSLQIWYLATQSIALASTVVGGAACAAYYPRAGRALLLAGSAGLIATLWWTPVVAAILLAAAIAVVLSLPTRQRSIVESGDC